MKQATAWMENALRNSTDPVEVEWDRVQDEGGHSAYTLKLRDFAGEVKARFTPEDLTRTKHLRIWVYSLLGQLLRIRSHKLLELLREASREDDNGAEPD